MRSKIRIAIVGLLAWCVLAGAPLASATKKSAPLDDFQGVFEDTVIQIYFVKVGSRVNAMFLGDIPDERHYMSVVDRFTAEQRVTFSVFGKRDYRVTFWGGEHMLAVNAAEPLDEPAGKGYRLTYEDGTVVEIIA